MGIIETLHGYVYGRWPYLCIGLGTGEHRLLRLMKPIVNLVFRMLVRFPSDGPKFDKDGLMPGGRLGKRFSRQETFADTYHAKVVRSDDAKKIVSVDQNIQLTNLEHVIPYSLAADIILQESNRILLLKCPCRLSRANPCLPADVCLVMGDPFVGFVAEHHPDRSRLIGKVEALELLSAEAERGHVHHAFFKEALFGRFFAICNCCSCCCGAMQAHRNGIPMLASSGYVCVADRTKCEACGTCVERCPFAAIRIVETHVVVDSQACMGCGVCIGLCNQKALSLKRDYTRSDPLDLQLLLSHRRPNKIKNLTTNTDQPATVGRTP